MEKRTETFDVNECRMIPRSAALNSENVDMVYYYCGGDGLNFDLIVEIRTGKES